MHLAEGTLPLVHALSWSAVAAPVVLWSLRGERRDGGDASSSVLMAGATSLLFAATLLPLPVPVLGATSHICLTPVLALIVGIRRIIWPTFFVLLLQAVFFAHGGITTLGVNTLSLGVVGPVVAVALWRVLGRTRADGPLGIAVACGLGSLSVYLADAVVLAGALSGLTAPLNTFGAVVLGFAPVQVPLAVLEAAASIGIVKLLAARRPDLLPAPIRLDRIGSKIGVVSLFALAPMTLIGCGYEGIDGTVFGSVAEQAGHPPTESVIDFSQGELGLATSILLLFGLGFIAGRSWERLFGTRDALSR